MKKSFTLSRREWLGLVSVGGLSACLGLSQLRKTKPHYARAFSMVFDPFVYFEPAGAKKAEYAVLWVHPAYLTYPGIPDYVRNSFATARYGNYDAYVRNITRLRKKQRQSRTLAVLGIEHDRFIGKDKLPKAFRPDENTVMIVTKDSSGKPADVIRYANGDVACQYPDTVFRFLKDNRIFKVYCGGEFAWYALDHAKDALMGDGQGCLTVLAGLFRENGFTVRGIRECIFPMVRPSDEQHPSQFLYTDQVDLLSNEAE